MAINNRASVLRRPLAVVAATALLAVGALATAPAASAAVPDAKSVSFSSADYIQGYTYGVGESDLFSGATISLPRFDPSLGELLSVSIDYQAWAEQDGHVYPSIDTGRSFWNPTNTTDDTVVCYTSDMILTGSVAGEVFPSQTIHTWTAKDFAGFPVPHGTNPWSAGQDTQEVSKNVKETLTFHPTQLSNYVGAGSFSLAMTAKAVESLTTEKGLTKAQGWESFGLGFKVTYQYQPPVTVTPEAPTLSTPNCGEAATVLLPTTEGVEYSKKTDGDTVTVTAATKDGYVLADGATSSWTLTIPEIVACAVPVTPAAPTLSTPACGQTAAVVLPSTEGVEYTKTVDGDSVVVVATAKGGYTLADGATSRWTLTVPKVVACTVPVTPAAPTLSKPACGEAATVVLTATEGVEYSKKADGDTVTVTATAKDGYVLAEGATSSWTLTIPKVVACGVVDDATDGNGGSNESELAWTGSEVVAGLPWALGAVAAGVTLITAGRRRRR